MSVIGVRIEAHAKVNLCLEVLGKRPDGFHEVRSVLQSISLADELWMEPAGNLTLECDVPGLAGEENLVVRAARALAAAAGIRAEARIVLRKGIPVAAGLGGASTDAAAALVGLARLWNLPPGRVDPRAVASDLGSDVPFFLVGGTALVSGRGEVVAPLPDAPGLWMVLLVPAHSLAAKTAELYRRLRPEQWSSGERTARLAETTARGERMPEDLLGNAFETAADQVFPTLAEHREAMRQSGASHVHLSGAGPALFALFVTEDAARRTAEGLAGRGHRAFLARTLSRADVRSQEFDIRCRESDICRLTG